MFSDKDKEFMDKLSEIIDMFEDLLDAYDMRDNIIGGVIAKVYPSIEEEDFDPDRMIDVQTFFSFAFRNELEIHQLSDEIEELFIRERERMLGHGDLFDEFGFGKN